MVNHVWTLLCNYDPQRGVGVPGYEYMEEEFRPVDLPSPLARVRSVLFGETPDLFFIHYRSRQLVHLLHAPQWERYVLALDKRISYDLNDVRLADPELYRPRLTLLDGSEPSPSLLLGAALPPDATGQSEYEILLERTGTSAVSLQMAKPFVQTTSMAVSWLPDGFSAPTAINATGYFVRFADMPVGSRWHFQVRLRPRWSIGRLVRNLEQAGADTQAALWGNRQSPYDEWQAAWQDGRDACTRLAALLLAFLYRVEERRRTQA